MKQFTSKSSLATIHPNGIIEICQKQEWDQPETTEVAKDMAMMLKKAVGNNIRGILYFPPNIYIQEEIIKAYTNVSIGHVAEAIVAESFATKLIANMLLKFRSNKLACKVFSKQEEAEQWLLEQISKAKMKASEAS